MIEVSVVSPVYHAEALIEKLVSQLREVLENVTSNYEILLVEDGGSDSSWEVIKDLCAKYPEVVGIKLSRNFGQHHAIAAGLSRAKGGWIVVMDCDLQDQPSEIPKLLDKAKKGYDVVFARRATRHDRWFKRMTSKLFYYVLGYLTGVKQDPAIANFGIYNKKVIAAINSMPETIRYFPTMVRWVGFHATALDVTHAVRPEGKTSYSFKKLLNLALDVCLANSDTPIRLVVKAGFTVSIIGFAFAVYTAIQAFHGEIQVLGYASLLISMWVLSGLIMIIVGIVGLYVGKSFEGIKNRPAYIVDEVLGGEN